MWTILAAVLCIEFSSDPSTLTLWDACGIREQNTETVGTVTVTATGTTTNYYVLEMRRAWTEEWMWASEIQWGGNETIVFTNGAPDYWAIYRLKGFTNGTPQCLGRATFEWDANTETNLAGYNLYQGTAPRQYYSYTRLNLDVTRCEITGIPRLTHYFTVTAVNNEGLESEYSNEVTLESKNE